MKKKKYFSYMLMGLLAVGATGTVTSCKDYDDDINAANKRIDDVNTALEQCKSNCETNIAALKSQLETQDAYAKNLKTIIDQLTTTVNSNTSDISTLRSNLQTISNTVASNTAATQTNAAAIAEAQAAINSISGRLATAESDIKTNAANIAQNVSDIKTNASNILANSGKIADNATAIEKNASDIKTNAAGIKANAEAIESAKAELKTLISNLEEKVDGNTAAINELKAQAEALQKSIDAVDAKVTKNAEDIAANATKIAKNAEDIVANAKNIAANKAAIEQNAKDIKTNADAIAALKTQVDANTADIAQLKTDIGQLRTDLTAKIEANAAAIAINKAAIDALIARMEAVEKQAEENKQGVADNKANIELVKSAQEAIKKAVSALQDELKNVVAEVASLTARIATLESSVTEIQEVLDNKVDKDVYNATITDIYSKLTAVDETLAQALKDIKANSEDIVKLQNDLNGLAGTVASVSADLEQQKATFEAFQKEVAEKYATVESLKELSDKLDSEVEKLQKAIEELGVADINGLQEALDGKANLADFNKLKATVESISDDIDSRITPALNELNVLISRSLRSLVFQPECYYWGIEAAKIKVLDYSVYKNIPTAEYNKLETKGTNQDHTRYDSVAAQRVLNFVATYHMNPSATDTAKFQSMRLLTDDKDFTRAAASAPFSIVGRPTVSNGDISLNVKVNDPSQIKNINNENMVTVFALEVTQKSDDNSQSTITSDYAAVYKQTISKMKLFHTAKTTANPIPFTNVKNTHDTWFKALGGVDQNHAHNGMLMQTVYEAQMMYHAQDTVNWNSTIDLSKLVEVHYIDVNGDARLLTAADMKANGLSYKFELTGWYYGNNKTSESSQAAINPEDNSILRPQAPVNVNNEGEQAAYGSKQDRATIGRRPVVRVSLVDEDKNVLDYGYISVRISDPGKEITPDQSISYTGDEWKYNYECTPNAYSHKTKWIQTQNDIYSLLNLSREEFLNTYEVETANDGSFQQYVPKAATGGYTFTRANSSQVVGAFSEHLDTEGHSDAQTQVLEWRISGADMLNIFNVANAPASVSRAIKYQPKTGYSGGIVYVMFTTGKITITQPSAKALLKDQQIPKYWFAKNTSSLGTDEIHANTLTPEDNAGGTAEELDDQISDVFTGNLKAVAPYIGKFTNLEATNTDYDPTTKLTLDFQFAKANESRTAYGVRDGVLEHYAFTIADNGKTLKAYIVGKNVNTAQEVAKITGSAASEQKVELVHSEDNNGYVEAMLNFKAHNALSDSVMNVAIGMFAQNECAMNLPLTENTFDVRFLRPLNVFDKGESIQDAANKLQTIDVTKLVQFTDWRDLWDGTAGRGNYTMGAGYTKYYGITSITIDGVDETATNDGGNIADNPKVMTNLKVDGSGKDLALKDVSTQVQFFLKNNTLTYKNLSSNVNDFYVKIPVAVHYIWGTVHQTVTINVKKSLNQAKKF